MSTYKVEQKKLDRLAEATEIAVQADTEVTVWLARHPEIKNILANKNILFQYFGRDLDDIDADPGGSLDQAYEHPKLRESLAHWPNEEDEKQELSNRIIELLRPGTSPQNLKAVKDGHRYKSVGELRIRVQELQERSEMHKKSTAELRAIIQRPAPEYSLPPEISAQQIKHMWGPDQFRYWTKKFNGSMEPINRRLAGQD
ncbi:MAG TPA: hypothetical protein VK709_19040 [Candidatus Saccharimonadales bacterium]|nr:hypothetical protein [Candidatus Saccharimonadales bacterium]